jgi:hypothetical protein
MELELWPARSRDICRKYGVESETEHREIVRLWEARLAASPNARAEEAALRASCREAARRMGWSRSGGG